MPWLGQPCPKKRWFVSAHFAFHISAGASIRLITSPVFTSAISKPSRLFRLA